MGQADAAFDFVARGSGYTLGLSATEAVMAVRSEPRPLGSGLSPLTNVRGSEKLVRMQVVGASE